MRGLSAVIGAGLSLLVFTAAVAAEPSVTIPNVYRFGTAPTKPGRASGFETPQGDAQLDGAFYAEVFPIFTGADGLNTSYLRLGAGATASTFDITVVGSQTGNLYGEGTIAVPANSSPQKTITQVLSAANVSVNDLANGDTTFSLYLTNPNSDAFYQHVIYNLPKQFFEDMSICPQGASLQGAKTLTNVHVSTLASGNFPSYVYIHNLQSIDASYTVTLRNSDTGLVVGTIPSITVAANATYNVLESFFEQQAGYTPVGSIVHVNLEFHATPAYAALLGAGPDPQDLGAIFGMVVYNIPDKVFLNISNRCLVNR